MDTEQRPFWPDGYEAENHWGLQYQTGLLRGGQIDREGHKGLTVERDKTTNLLALEANVGRMPRYGMGPAMPRRFQLLHTQEPVVSQATPSF